MDFDEKVRMAVTLAAAKIAAGKVGNKGLDLDEAGAIIESFDQVEQAIDGLQSRPMEPGAYAL